MPAPADSPATRAAVRVLAPADSRATRAVRRRPLDHDDGSQFTNDVGNMLVFGGCKNYVGDTKTLDVHVKRVRAKIEEDPGNPVSLVTVRGLGYKFEL